MKSFIAALRNLVLPWGRTTGRRIVLDGDNGEILIYNALDQRVVLLTSQDPPGLVVGADTEPQVKVIAESGNIGRIIFDPNSPAGGVVCALTEAIFNEGAANEHVSFQIQGPGVTGATDRLEMLINSQNADGSSEANWLLRVAGGDNLANVDKTAGWSFFRRIAIAPPASAALNALLIAAASGHTAGLIQAQVGSTFIFAVGADGRILTNPQDDATEGLLMAATGGFTGDFVRCSTDGIEQFAINDQGIITTYNENGMPTWSPTISGGGAATFSTLNGQYLRFGPLTWVRLYAVVGVAGSGAANVTFDLPVTPDRTRGRQSIPGGARDGGVAGAGPVVALVFAGGAGANIDRIVNSAGTDVTGALLTAGSIWIFEAWIREAV